MLKVPPFICREYKDTFLRLIVDTKKKKKQKKMLTVCSLPELLNTPRTQL